MPIQWEEKDLKEESFRWRIVKKQAQKVIFQARLDSIDSLD